MIVVPSLATALSLAAVLSGAVQDPAPETRREVRIVTSDGPGDLRLGGAGSFARLDKDSDGFISREEYVGPTTDAFRVLDKNNDGRISREEMNAGRDVARTILGGGAGGAGGPMIFSRRGGFDGALPGGGPRALFLGGPGGENREVTVIARGAGEEGEGPARFTLRRPGGGAGSIVLGGPGGIEGGPADLDKDGDGKVSEEEFLAPLREAFRRMDKDGSGALEADEHGPGSNVHVFTRRIERPTGD